MKRIGAVVSVMALMFVLSFTPQVTAEEVPACYQKEHGQLRVVSDNSQCLPSEKPIILNQSSTIQTSKLACVTGALENETYDPTNIRYHLIITNQKNIDINDSYDVFSYDEGPSEESWGLTCNEDWVNTGCSSSSYDNFSDVDVAQYLNGCHSDDEEYGNVTIFTTCCKNVSN